jgi:hypothetical protein
MVDVVHVLVVITMPRFALLFGCHSLFCRQRYRHKNFSPKPDASPSAMGT